MTTGELVLKEDPNRQHRLWFDGELYMGPDQPGKGYVPNVNDGFLSWATGLQRVVFVNPTTKVPEFEPFDPLKLTGVRDENLLLGVGPGYIDETYRVYINDSVTPHTLTADSGLHAYGSDIKGYRIFLGNNVHDNSEVISVKYNQSGQIVGDLIEMEHIGMTPEDSRPIWAPLSGHTHRTLEDGELVTLVAYNENNDPVSFNKLLVMNTQFVKRATVDSRVVTGIRLESPYLSPDDPERLNVPLNLPLSSILMEGVVTYNDGKEERHEIDGNVMSLFGMEGYIPTIVGQRVPLVLNYLLKNGEATFMDAPNGRVGRTYNAYTTQKNTLYQVKLFVAPKWIGDSEGYRLRFFLYNLDRNIAQEVTEHVNFESVNLKPFQPTLYGYKQSVAAVLNLQDVDPDYNSYIHIQPFDITLRDRAHNRRDPWTIDYNHDGEYVYGNGVYAHYDLNGQNYDIDLTFGEIDLPDWLLEVYRRTDPMVNRKIEGEAPMPTHLKVVIDGTWEFNRPIAQWRDSYRVDFLPTSRCTVDVFFTRDTGTTVLQLGMATFNVEIR